MRGDGSLYQRKESRIWWMTYYVRGQQVRASTRETDRGKARDVLRERIADVVRGEALPHEHRLTLGDLLDFFWADYEMKGRRWLKTVKYPIRHLADFFGEKSKAFTITTDRVQRYVRARQQEQAASATINLELAVLGRAFTLAVRAKRVRVAPFIPRLPADATRVREGFFTRDEIAEVCDRLPADVADAVWFLFFSAWRIGEVRTLEWRDYDRNDGVIRLRAENSKTRYSRVLPVVGEIAAVVERRLARRRLDLPLVFHRDGRRLGDFRKVWKSACVEIGLEGRIVHDLRRSGVKHLISAGVDPHTVMAFSGHRTASMLKRYHIIGLDDLRVAAERASAFPGRPGQVVRLKPETAEQSQNHAQSGSAVELRAR